MAPRAPDSLHRPLWPPPRVECAQSWDGQRWLRAWAPIPQGGRTCNRPPGKAPAPAQLTPSDLAPASPGIGPSEAALGRRWARGTLWLRAHAPVPPRPCPCHLASCPECHRGPFRRAGVLVAPPPDVPLLVAGPEREHLLRPEGTPEWSGCRWLLPAMICLRTRA